jgi:hypothetical protein
MRVMATIQELPCERHYQWERTPSLHQSRPIAPKPEICPRIQVERSVPWSPKELRTIQVFSSHSQITNILFPCTPTPSWREARVDGAENSKSDHLPRQEEFLKETVKMTQSEWVSHRRQYLKNIHTSTKLAENTRLETQYQKWLYLT